MKNQKNKLRLKRLAILAVLFVVVALVGGIFAYRQFSDKPATPDNTNTIDLSPATEEEKKDSERHKDEVAKNDEVTTPQQPGLSVVTPIIVDASQYGDQIEVRAYISEVYEDAGTCTITISKGALKVTKQSVATKDATTTRCANVNIGRTEFPETGQWSAIVSYLSTTSQGSSQPKSLEVK